MFEALTHSDLASIHDLAVARARLDGHLSRGTPVAEREALTARLTERIAALSTAAQAELLALVRLGQAAGRVDWATLLSEARVPHDCLLTPRHIAPHLTL